MESLAISKFKATCLAVLERVQRTGQPVLVTKRGVPVAQVIPPPKAAVPRNSAFGALAGMTKEVGDILEPLPAEDWESLI